MTQPAKRSYRVMRGRQRARATGVPQVSFHRGPVSFKLLRH